MIKNIYGPTWNCRNNYFSKTSLKKPQTLKTHFSQNLFANFISWKVTLLLREEEKRGQEYFENDSVEHKETVGLF